MKLEPIKNDGSFALSTSNLPKQGVAVILKSTENQANIKDCSAAHAFSVKKQAETALPVWSNKNASGFFRLSWKMITAPPNMI